MGVGVGATGAEVEPEPEAGARCSEPAFDFSLCGTVFVFFFFSTFNTSFGLLKFVQK